jgi:limonene-1,2-epoxide hydrolase
MSEENVEVVLEGIGRFEASDFEGVSRRWHPDSWITGPEGWPERGPFEGRDAVLGQFRRLAADWGEHRVAVHALATTASRDYAEIRQPRRFLMPTFAVIAEHPPDLCPTSNAQTRQILKEGATQIPQLAEQLGVSIGTLRIFGPDHIILAVVEADDISSVRDFALQSRLMQWNTVKIHATYSIEEAVAMIDDVETIF